MNSKTLNFLFESWQQTSDTLEILPSMSESIYNFLIHMYNDPRRHYHNLDHIYLCLKEFDASGLNNEYDAKDQAIIRAALWFHDVVYNPVSKENEYHSAILAEHLLQYTAYVLQIKHSILYTTHTIDINDIKDKSLYNIYASVLDIDLAGLSSPLYKINSANIIKEYTQHFSPAEIKTGRINFLKSMLSKASIYYTNQFKPREFLARKNMVNELVELLESDQN